MATFMVVCTFKEGTNMQDVFAVVEAETAQVRALEAEDRLAGVHLSLARGTVFLEVVADDAAAADQTVRTLPMAVWWDIDVYPTAPPTIPGSPA